MKKKTKKIVNETKTNSSMIGYKGDVKITIRKGDVGIYSKTYHNAGRIPMFKFIAWCLCGEYASAQGLRPKFVQLFNRTSVTTGTPVSSDVTWDNDMQYMSNKVIYNGTPLPETDEDNNKASASFSFTVPFSQVTSGRINVFALFSQENYGSTSNPSAYFLLTKMEDGEEVWDELLPNINIDNSNDYNIYIQWVITISNK